MFKKREICVFYDIDEDDQGGLEDARFLLKIDSLDLQQVLDEKTKFDKMLFKLELVKGRIRNGEQSDNLESLLGDTIEYYYSLKESAENPVSNCIALNQLKSIAKVIVQKYPKILLVEGQLKMLPGEYMPGDQLMKNFGQKLANLIYASNSCRLQSLDNDFCCPALIWSYSRNKEQCWVINFFLLTNYDVYNDLGYWIDRYSLCSLVLNSWAYSLGIHKSKAQNLILFYEEEAIISDASMKEKYNSIVYQITQNLYLHNNSDRYCENLSGAEFFEPN